MRNLKFIALLLCVLFSFSVVMAEVYVAKEILTSLEHDTDFSRANVIAADHGESKLYFFDQTNFLGYITDLDGRLTSNIDFSDVGFLTPTLFVASPFRVGFFGNTAVLTQINYRTKEVVLARFNENYRNVEKLKFPAGNISAASVAIDSNGCVLLAVLDNNKLTLYYDSNRGFVKFAEKATAIDNATNNVEITSFFAGFDLKFAIALAAPSTSITFLKNKPALQAQVKYASSIIYTGKSGDENLQKRIEFAAISKAGEILPEYKNYTVSLQNENRISVPLFTSMQMLHNGDIVCGASVFDPHIRLVSANGKMSIVKPYSIVSGGQAVAFYCPYVTAQNEHLAGTDTPKLYDYIYMFDKHNDTIAAFDTELNLRKTIYPQKSVGFLRPISVISVKNNVYIVTKGASGDYKLVTATAQSSGEATFSEMNLLPLEGKLYIANMDGRFIIGDIVKNGVVGYNYAFSNNTVSVGQKNIDTIGITEKYSPCSPIITGSNGRMYILNSDNSITSIDKTGKFISSVKIANALDLISADKDGNLSVLEVRNNKYAVTTYAPSGAQLRWKSLNLDLTAKIFPINLNGKVYLYVADGVLYELDASMSIISSSTVHFDKGKLLEDVVAVCANDDTGEIIFALTNKLLSIKL